MPKNKNKGTGAKPGARGGGSSSGKGPETSSRSPSSTAEPTRHERHPESSRGETATGRDRRMADEDIDTDDQP